MPQAIILLYILLLIPTQSFGQNAPQEHFVNTQDELKGRIIYRIGADAELLPSRRRGTQDKEQGLFSQLDVDINSRLADWSAYGKFRAFAASSELTATSYDREDEQRNQTSVDNSYVQLRRLWLRYHGLTPYPGEHLTLGLQRIRSSSALWWDSNIEALVWRFISTRLNVQAGIGQRYEPYRTNSKLSITDEDKLRLFTEVSYDWQAYHEIHFRSMYTSQDSHDTPDDIQSGAPEGINGEWFWYGVGLSSNWNQRRSTQPYAYTIEWTGLSGKSDFLSQEDTLLSQHTISAWSVDAGFRYDFSSLPASIGVTFSKGSGGFDDTESSLFVQTGLQRNRSRYAGNDIFLYRFNDALRPDLTNLIHASVFSSWNLSDKCQFAGSVSILQRDDNRLPVYRNSQPLHMNKDSNAVGTGINLTFRHELDSSIFSAPLKYLRLRSSVFFPGQAFKNDSNDTVYRVSLELYGVFTW